MERNKVQYTREDLIKIIRDLYVKLGRTPTKKDMPEHMVSICHAKFGKWCYALETAGVKTPSEAALARRARQRSRWKRAHNAKRSRGNKGTNVQLSAQDENSGNILTEMEGQDER